MNTEEMNLDETFERSAIDNWIISKLHHLIEATDRALDTHRFDLYATAIYEFAWHEYCDWYLELAKPLLWDESRSKEQAAGTRRTLVEVLEAMLRIAHPVIPYITEVLWRQVSPRLGVQAESIMLQSYPLSDEFPADLEAEARVEWVKDVITAVRNIRGEANIKPSQQVDLLLQGGTPDDRAHADQSGAMLKRLANVGATTWLDDSAEAPPHALALVSDLRVMVPLAGLIDVAAERARLQKEIERNQADLARVEGKLGNPNFVNKAPSAVVDKERVKAADLRTRIAALEDQLEKLESLR